MPPHNLPNLFVYTPPTPLERLLNHPLLFLSTTLYTHQAPITPPPAPKNPTSLVCISDTHTAQPILPQGDILLHAGDLSINGTRAELQHQIAWLAARPHAHKLFIAGNHDRALAPSDPHHALHPSGTIYLHSTTTTLSFPHHNRTLRIYGAPHTPRQGNWTFQYPPSQARDIWHRAVPDGIDVLVTHGPARGHLDGGAGCPALLAEMRRVKPRVHVHGHIHRGRGVEVLDWGVVQGWYEGVCLGERCVGALFVALGAWMWDWAVYWVLGRKRTGRSVVVNAAWEGNEEGGVTVVYI